MFGNLRAKGNPNEQMNQRYNIKIAYVTVLYSEQIVTAPA
jgi:hypothetical protein